MSDNKTDAMRGLIDHLMGQPYPTCQELGQFLDWSNIATVKELFRTLEKSQPQVAVDIETETPEIREWNDVHLAEHVYINGQPIRTLTDVDIEMLRDSDDEQHAIVTLRIPATAPTLDLDKISRHAQVSVRGAGSDV